MKRVVVFAMVLMLGVVSVQAGISFSEVRSVLYAKGI